MPLFKNTRTRFIFSAAISAVLGGGSAWLTNLYIARALGPVEGENLPEYQPPSSTGVTSPKPAEGFVGPRVSDSAGEISEGDPAESGGVQEGDVPGVVPDTTERGIPVATADPEGGEGMAPPTLTHFEPIITRNIFSSDEVQKLLAAQQMPSSDNPEEMAAPAVAPLCVYVLGTMEASPARYSWAIIARDKNNTDKDIFNLWGDVFGMGTLAAVRRVEIDVRRPDGSIVTVKVREECQTGGGAPAPVAPAEDAQASAGGEGIQQNGDNSFTIDQSEINKAMSNLEQLSRDARVAAHYQNGEVIGFKVFRIKPGSLYSKLGLRNGDIIQSVNGKALDSTEQALALVNTLKNEKNFNIEIRRRNEPVTLSYSIR